MKTRGLQGSVVSMLSHEIKLRFVQLTPMLNHPPLEFFISTLCLYSLTAASKSPCSNNCVPSSRSCTDRAKVGSSAVEDSEVEEAHLRDWNWAVEVDGAYVTVGRGKVRGARRAARENVLRLRRAIRAVLVMVAMVDVGREGVGLSKSSLWKKLKHQPGKC